MSVIWYIYCILKIYYATTLYYALPQLSTFAAVNLQCCQSLQLSIFAAVNLCSCRFLQLSSFAAINLRSCQLLQLKQTLRNLCALFSAGVRQAGFHWHQATSCNSNILLWQPNLFSFLQAPERLAVIGHQASNCYVQQYSALTAFFSVLQATERLAVIDIRCPAVIKILSWDSFLFSSAGDRQACCRWHQAASC